MDLNGQLQVGGLVGGCCFEIKEEERNARVGHAMIISFVKSDSN